MPAGRFRPLRNGRNGAAEPIFTRLPTVPSSTSAGRGGERSRYRRKRLPRPPQADRLLAGAWQKLSERERQLLWLAYAEEFAHEEIAAITGLRAGSLKVLLSRARDRARNLLGGEEG